jgi:glycerol-3-phosphate dehydrogenase (NAD+)
MINPSFHVISSFCEPLTPNSLTQPDTLLSQSCGVADMIATCYGGRNRLCSELFCREIVSVYKSGSTFNQTSIRWIELEKRALGGQKLQGLSTLDELMTYIETIPQHDEIFPLIYRIHSIARKGAHPNTLFKWK